MDHEEPGIMDLVYSVDQQLLIALSHLDDAMVPYIRAKSCSRKPASFDDRPLA